PAHRPGRPRATSRSIAPSAPIYSATLHSFALKSANIRDGAQSMGRSAAGRFAFIVTIAALALIGRPGAAEPPGFPTTPVPLILPYTPGSPNDVVARVLARQLQVKHG